MTGLALLAFLGAGLTPSSRVSYVDPVTHLTMKNGDVVRRGIDFLIDHQASDGLLGPEVGQLLYNHAIATLALTEAYGLTNAFRYRAPAQKAVDYLVRAQNQEPDGTRRAWRYLPRSGRNDTAVTGWCVMALKSAQISGLDVPETALAGAKNWIASVTDDEGRVGYLRRGDDKTFARGLNEDWESHPSLTAIGMLTRLFADKNRDDPALAQGAALLLSDLPRWDPSAPSGKPADFYYWYYASLALSHFDGLCGPSASRWNKAVREVLSRTQCTKKDGCADGSWPAEQDRWAFAGGRVYATAINVLTLEQYCAYPSVFGSKEPGGR